MNFKRQGTEFSICAIIECCLVSVS